MQGLRQRQLFQLAETYCHQLLDSDSLSPTRRAHVAVELIRTYADHARHSPPAPRQRLWQAAQQVAVDYQQTGADSSYALLVGVQNALALLARGQLWQQEAELQMAGAVSIPQVQTQLRTAIRSLQALDEEITRQIPRRHRAGDAARDELSIDELHTLRDNVRFQIARALRTQARCFSKESADYIDALTQSLSRLAKLSTAAVTDPLRWLSRIEQIACYRMLNRPADARRLVREALAAEPPNSIVASLRAEQARLALAEGDPQGALDMVGQPNDSQSGRNAELDLLRVEIYVALWQEADRAGDQPQAATWQNKAAETIGAGENRHGLVWQRQAESLLATAASLGEGTENLDVLTRSAENFYRRGQLDDAVAAYVDAADKAKAAGTADRAFELSYKAASIDHSRRHYREALTRFQQIAMSNPAHSQAAEAHLLSVLCASLQARQSTDASLDLYQSLLEEHLRHWPQAATSSKARWWLGRLLEHQQQWSQAATVYRGISVEFPEVDQVLDSLFRCFQRSLSELPDTDRPAAADQAARYFEDVVGRAALLDQPVGATMARQAAVHAAEIRIRFGDQGYRAAADVLKTTLPRDDGGENRDPRTTKARSLWVVALAGQDQWREAIEVLRQTPDASPLDLVTILDLLSRFDPRGPDLARRELGTLQLTVADRLRDHTPQLRESERNLWGITVAEALDATGRPVEALAAFEQLVDRLPENGRVQAGYATLLLDSDDPARLAQALDRWRHVLQKSPPRSARWFRAKYGIALAHYKLGNKPRASKVIQLTRALYPGLGGTEMREQFVKLLDRCARP